MSIRNLQHATVRRYVEEVPMIRQARIYCESRPTYKQWAEDAEELTMLWVTETDSQGKRRLDKDRPSLDAYPEYRLQCTQDMGARIWVNICCTNEEEYNRIIREARAEAAYTLEQKARWKDYTSKHELTGKIDEVAPAAVRQIVSKFN